MKTVLHHGRHVSRRPSDVIDSIAVRDQLIAFYKLDAIAAWLRDRDIQLNIENVQCSFWSVADLPDDAGYWLVSTFWADLTIEQHVELQLALG